MSDNVENNTEPKASEKIPLDKKKILREFLDGSVLTKDIFIKQLPYIFFLTFLAGVYITNRYNAEKLVKQASKLQREISDLRSESVAIASELMFLSNQTQVAKLLKEKGMDLKEVTVAPKKIVIKKMDN